MIKQFTSYLVNIKGYSENTARAYASDLKTFAWWVRTHRPCERWSTITRETIDAFITDAALNGCKPATTNRMLSSISGIYRYFIRQGWLTKNPCRYQSRRKDGHHIPNTIPIKDLQAAYANSVGLVHVWIGLLASTGMRVGEMLLMNWEDIDFVQNSIKVLGKGAKERIIYTSSDYLKELKQVHERTHQKGKIWNHDPREVRLLIWRTLKDYSSAKQLSPHAIRHTYATEMAKQGANVVTIAKALGHNQIATTQKYIDMASLDTRQAMCNAKII